ncbi:MAG TPA: type II toxin-antitoxin system RelE/ParE family toxin [Telluria sp.]
MQPNYKPPFKKFVKKQHPPLQLAIEDAVDEIVEDPTIGEPKTGDLKGVFVFKFIWNNVEYLIAYHPPTDEETLEVGMDVDLLYIDFYKVGTHENFYADLKKIPEVLGAQR